MESSVFSFLQLVAQEDHFSVLQIFYLSAMNGSWLDILQNNHIIITIFFDRSGNIIPFDKCFWNANDFEKIFKHFKAKNDQNDWKFPLETELILFLYWLDNVIILPLRLLITVRRITFDHNLELHNAFS